MKKLKKRIFITGAGGFIGKNLVQKLRGKYSLLTPNRLELNLLNKGAVNNYFKENSIDVVIHCAVVGGSRKEEFVGDALSQNLRIFFNVINNRKHFRKMICFGSGAEYDKSEPIINVKESDFGTKIPTDDYGLFKYICSKYVESLNNDKIYYLRIFGLYGKHEDYRYRFISNAICRNITGLPITIGQNVYFDYLNIDDFIKIVDYFITHKSKHKFFNIGTGAKIDILSLAKKINTVAIEKSKIIIKKKGLNNEYTCDNSRLIKEIKCLSFKSHDDGISELYEWYCKKKDSILL
ncbi:MAG: NAD-dependent epimerase/dehydratase family protein [Patescibacteria group bacterium]